MIGVAIEFVLPLSTRIKDVPGLGIVGALVFAIGAAIAGWSLLIYQGHYRYLLALKVWRTHILVVSRLPVSVVSAFSRP